MPKPFQYLEIDISSPVFFPLNVCFIFYVLNPEVAKSSASLRIVFHDQAVRAHLTGSAVRETDV